MTLIIRIVALGLATALLAACSQEDLDHFYSEGSGTWAPVDYDGASSGGYTPTRCYQTSDSIQTCFR